jgi:glycosyltransferase involved in cell wall biosynthesis
MADIGSVLFHNPTNDGGGHYIKQLELLERFVDEGVTAYFVSPGGFDDAAGAVHVPDRRADADGLRGGLVAHLLAVFREVVVRSPDRFVPFTIFGGLVGAVASLLGRTETVLFVRGDLFAGRAMAGDPKYVLLRKVLVVVEAFTFRFVDRVVFISEQNREMMLGRARLSRDDVDSVVLYNDVYTERIREQLAEEPRDLEGHPRLGYAGGFPSDEGKGLRYLVDAVADLADEFPDVRLYLLGDGGNIDALRAHAQRRGVADRVCFTGWVDDPVRYMCSFDLFVLPSLHEGLGNSLLEALAAETPIVGSDVGGIPEVVGDGAYVFEPASATAIADTVRDVFASEESYERALAHCRERRDRFDFDWAGAATTLVEDIDDELPDRLPEEVSPAWTGHARAMEV